MITFILILYSVMMLWNLIKFTYVLKLYQSDTSKTMQVLRDYNVFDNSQGYSDRLIYTGTIIVVLSISILWFIPTKHIGSLLTKINNLLN